MMNWQNILLCVTLWFVFFFGFVFHFWFFSWFILCNSKIFPNTHIATRDFFPSTTEYNVLFFWNMLIFICFFLFLSLLEFSIQFHYKMEKLFFLTHPFYVCSIWKHCLRNKKFCIYQFSGEFFTCIFLFDCSLEPKKWKTLGTINCSMKIFFLFLINSM